MPQAIHISPIDNVVVALHPIAKGTLVEVDGLSVTALEDIPQGHKMAVKPIKNGENVIKYGFPIGHATADAAPGSWMHTHNVHTNLSGEVEYSYNPAPDLAPLPKVEPETFMGFRRKDGRAAFYPSITLSGSAGWTNSAGSMIVNPGKFLASAVASLTQPLFNKGANIAQLKIAKAQQEEARLSFEQTLLNAGVEVNEALVQYQTAREKADYYDKQVASLQTAAKSTSLLMKHGNTTYLEVLTAQQTLLNAQLSQVANRFTEIQGVITLYQALGGGRM